MNTLQSKTGLLKPITTHAIDQYAQSMFAQETLHPRWISDCAAYLKQLFGGKISGARVIDYAFGRGNWSLAFKEAGAKEVISIDASPFNVERFTHYLKKHGISGITALEGNMVEQPLTFTADIVWLYGVLHHVPKDELLLTRLTKCLADKTSLMLIYGYNAGSLREAVMEPARHAFIYDDYNEFTRDAAMFTPPARLRARDDLTAPHITWYKQKDLLSLIHKVGLSAYEETPSFAAYLAQEDEKTRMEFAPWHYMCGLDSTKAMKLLPTIDQRHDDIALLYEWGMNLLPNVKDRAREFAAGIANTHFSAMQYGGYAMALVENFRYLLWLTVSLGIPTKGFSQKLQDFIKAGQEATVGGCGPAIKEKYPESFLADYLANNRIRL